MDSDRYFLVGAHISEILNEKESIPRRSSNLLDTRQRKMPETDPTANLDLFFASNCIFFPLFSVTVY